MGLHKESSPNLQWIPEALLKHSHSSKHCQDLTCWEPLPTLLPPLTQKVAASIQKSNAWYTINLMHANRGIAPTPPITCCGCWEKPWRVRWDSHCERLRGHFENVGSPHDNRRGRPFNGGKRRLTYFFFGRRLWLWRRWKSTVLGGKEGKSKDALDITLKSSPTSKTVHIHAWRKPGKLLHGLASLPRPAPPLRPRDLRNQWTCQAREKYSHIAAGTANMQIFGSNMSPQFSVMELMVCFRYL